MAVDFAHTRLSLRRSPLSYTKVQQALSPLARKWPWRRALKPGQMLNLGCGPYPTPGFYNVDYGFRHDTDLAWDLTKPMPFPDNTAGGAFSEHMFEHIPLEAGQAFLRDLYRVLQPGAPIRISVPDGEIYLRNYAAGREMPYGASDRAAWGDDFSPILSVNRIFYRDAHRCIYDFALMEAVMRRAGFVDIRKEAFGTGRDARLLIDQPGRAVESLYVEAAKPR